MVMGKHFVSYRNFCTHYFGFDEDRPFLFRTQSKKNRTCLGCALIQKVYFNAELKIHTNRHRATPTDVPRHPKGLFGDVWPFRLTSKGVLWCLLVSDGVCQCLMLSGDVGRVSEEFLSCLWRCVLCKILMHLRVLIMVALCSQIIAI